MQKEKKADIYRKLIGEIESVLDGCPDMISGMASVASILHHGFSGFFWTGFYRVSKPSELVIGPYQGTLACLTIPFDSGVCGLSADSRETVVVDDVEDFEGYIACDKRTSSEIVVPVFSAEDKLVGVLDIDSTELSAFDMTDAEYLQEICRVLGEKCC